MAQKDIVPLKTREEYILQGDVDGLKRAESIWKKSGRQTTPKKLIASYKRGFKRMKEGNAKDMFEAKLTKLMRYEPKPQDVVDLFIELLQLPQLSPETKIQMIINSVNEEHLDDFDENATYKEDYGTWD